MALENRKAFTLVELLVVVVIISMLMALLLPAVIGARARARQTQCMNREQELGKALLQYEGAKGHLPGYVNDFGISPNTGNLSWVIMVFQYLGEGDMWKRWRSSSVLLADKVDPDKVDEFAAVDLTGVICPSDDPTEMAPLSYVVNCGLSNIAADVADLAVLSPLPPGWDATKAAKAVTDPAYGLFFDHTVPASARTRVMLDKIPDGAQHTIMLSENIQATQWATVDTSVPPPPPWPPRKPRQYDVGIVWWSENLAAGPVVPGDGRKINDERETATYPNWRYDGRPSSAHVGGAVVTFADGHSDFQSEDIEYSVYQSLMTPEISKAKTQGLVSP